MSISSFSCLDANVGFSWRFHSLIVSQGFFFLGSNAISENSLNYARWFSAQDRTRYFYLLKTDGMGKEMWAEDFKWSPSALLKSAHLDLEGLQGAKHGTRH